MKRIAGGRSCYCEECSVKKSSIDSFIEYTDKLPRERVKELQGFFAEFSTHCLLENSEKKRLQKDFEAAILYYTSMGVSQEKALKLLDVKNLGGFYARPSILWFPLDDAAKIYPLSMERGRMSVFRLSVYLKRDVVPELLQMALNFTVKRFPSFATTLKKGFFWHYLSATKRRFCVEPEKDVPCQPLKVARSGSQSFRVIYYNRRISVEFFHVLTDGTGGMTFLKTLTAEYLRLTGSDIGTDNSLWDINSTPETEEYENAFAKVPLSENASGFVDKLAVQMSGRLAKVKPCRIIHLKMNVNELKNASAKYHGTITAYLLALMFLAGKAATDELVGDMNIQVPVNMRKFYSSKTIRNFSLYCGIRMPIAKVNDLSSIVRDVDEQLKEKASRETMGKMLTATRKMVNTVRYIPLTVKRPVAKIVYGFLGDKIFTNTLSNLGVVNMPSCISEQIESMDFVLGTAITNRAGCAAVTFGDTTIFSITKLTADPTFEEKMYELLCRDGIKVTAEGSELYEN